MFVKLLFFLFASLFLFYLPGKLLYRRLYPDKKTSLASVTLAFSLGIVLFTLSCFVFYWLRLKFLIWPVLIGADFACLRLYPLPPAFPKFKLARQQLVLIALIVIGTATQASLIFPSSIPQKDGSLFFLGTPFMDATWHLAIINQIQQHFPPAHPNFSGEMLKNYHYLYDLLLAGVNYIFPFLTAADLYFQLFPILLATLYGLANFILGNSLGKNKQIGILAVFLGYFASSFAYLIPLIPGQSQTVWHESSFWMIQPFSMLLNQHLAMSFVLLILGFFALNQKQTFLTIIFWGFLAGFKVYGGIVVIVSLVLAALFNPWPVKFKLFKLVIPITLVAILLILPASSQSSTGFFILYPGYFLRKLVEDPDRLPIPDWILREEYYRSVGNWPRIVQLRLNQLAIFIFGNLGIRPLMTLLLIGSVFKKIKSDLVWQLLFIDIAICLILPQVIIQISQPAITIQFAYYALVLFNYPAAMGIYWLAGRFKSIRLRAIAFTVVFIFAGLTCIREALFEYRKTYLIDNLQYQALKNLATLPGGIVLSNLPDSHLCNSFGQKPVWLSLNNTELTGIDTKSRQEKLAWFFSNIPDENQRRMFLNTEKINYLYLNSSQCQTIHCLYLGKQVYANTQVVIIRLP